MAARSLRRPLQRLLGYNDPSLSNQDILLNVSGNTMYLKMPYFGFISLGYLLNEKQC